MPVVSREAAEVSPGMADTCCHQIHRAPRAATSALLWPSPSVFTTSSEGTDEGVWRTLFPLHRECAQCDPGDVQGPWE